MNFALVIQNFVLASSIFISFTLYAESGKLLLLMSSSDSDALISAGHDTESEIVFPNEFKLRAGTGRILLSRERILSIPIKGLNNEFVGGYDKIASYEWKTKFVSEIKYPLDSGIRILRGFISIQGDLDNSIFSEIHSNGEQRLFRLDRDKSVFFPHFDKFRKTAVLDDFISSGAHIFRVSIKDKSVKNLESSFTGTMDGYSQRLYYCKVLNCKPEEVLSDKAILSARLINKGKQIVFLTPGSVDNDSKYYNLESYDTIEKKRTKLWSFKTGLKFPSGRVWNLGNPIFKVFENSSTILLTDEISEIGDDSIQNWKIVDVENGKVKDFKIPDGYQWAPMMPVSYHTSSSDSDVSALDPFLVFVKAKYLTDGTEYNFKVIQVSERKTILSFTTKGISTLRNAIYIPDSRFLNQ